MSYRPSKEDAEMPSTFPIADLISQVRALLRLSSSLPTSDWCATFDSGCLAISVAHRHLRIRYDHSCHRSNGIRSAVMVFASGRTFDPNSACTDTFLGRMFFDGTNGRTRTIVAGSPTMLDLYAFEAMSQLVSPHFLAEMPCGCVR